jgi:anti-sigma regulatory factor (Ser/Thr protein kinase)
MEEDRVFDEIGISLNLQSELSEQGYEIVRYAFTEILNNAIDHSGSTRGELVFDLQAYDLHFSISDFGVGIFQNIADSCHLPDEYAALGHLLKGKQTTMPERHSGEGLFFTSKIGDEVSIRSHALTLSFLNSRKDLITGEIPRLKGTDVSFTIKKQTKKSLQKLFEHYAPEKYEYIFSRTKVQVKLYQRTYMSRSEGRRLVSGLHEFREIIFDFRGVASIGQAFSDEVFRLFPLRHPDIRIEIAHANPAIIQMLKHVGVDNTRRIVIDK